MLEKLLEELYYNPNTGIFKWKIDKSHKVKSGDIAGTFNNKGYCLIRFNYKRYLAHRLAWLMYYGEWPKNNIDHINGIVEDNRISNLRDIPQHENCMNHKAHREGKLVGASMIGGKKRSKPWASTIRINGKSRFLGYFKTELEAHEAYMKEYNKIESNA